VGVVIFGTRHIWAPTAMADVGVTEQGYSSAGSRTGRELGARCCASGAPGRPRDRDREDEMEHR
jgi:hypothetical protein